MNSSPNGKSAPQQSASEHASTEGNSPVKPKMKQTTVPENVVTLDDSDDRRNTERVTTSMNVRFRVMKAGELVSLFQAIDDGKSPDLSTYAQFHESDFLEHESEFNISVGGLGSNGDWVITDKNKLESGTDLLLEIIDFPDGKGILRAVAEVMWAKEQDGEEYNVGLMFLYIGDEDTQRIRSLVFSKMCETD
jgi:hypothetical protein